MLERLQIHLRRWSTWEAVDLGFALLREHAASVYGMWLSIYLPCAIALFWLFHSRAWIALLFMWWLLPFFDRVALQALAKATFGDQARLRSLPSDFSSSLRHGLLASLLWRRINLHRSFTLPIWQLEGQRGPGFRRRAPILLRRARGGAQLLTVACFLLMLAFSLALLMGALYVAPAGMTKEWARRWIFPDDGPGFLVYATPILALAVLEPFYVAGGFALYLNRRVQLEAWDLDLAFRKMAQRLRELLSHGAASVALVCFVLMGRPLHAQEKLSGITPRAELHEVLKAPEFQTWSQEKKLHWKFKPMEPKAQKPFSLPEGSMKAIGYLLKGIVILAAALGIFWFLWRFAFSRGKGESAHQPDALPEDLFGLDVRPGSLPKDVGGAALALWQQGQRREALSLLYRGALARLIHARGMEVSKGSTEGDCLRVALPLLAAEPGGYFRNLTLAWQRQAYAHLEPSSGEQLCLDWARFEEALRG